MSILHHIPGLIYVKTVTNPNVNQGKPVALFEPAAPKDKPSINTAEGWNAMVKAQNLRYFRLRYGRDPHNEDELKRYADALADPRNTHLPADVFGTIEAG